MKQLSLAGLGFLCALGLSACTTVSPGDAAADGSQGGQHAGAGEYEDGAVTHGYDDAHSFPEGDFSSSFYDSNPKCKPAAMVAGRDQRIFFDFDRSDIKSGYEQALKVQAEYLAANPHVKVRIEGNTDDRGSREYNVALAWRRDQAVANFLQQYGVAKDQLVLVSYGAERPMALGNSDQAYQCNRRVDLNYRT